VLNHIRRGKRGIDRQSNGQTLVEFALALPVILLIMVMIAEFGWYVAQSSASIAAAREAGRYASSVGDSPTPGLKRYRHCDGIRAAARRGTSQITTLPASQIQVVYLSPTGTTIGSCTNAEPGGTAPADSAIPRFSQAEITVTLPYQAMTPLGSIFLGNRNLVAIDRRTIAKAP
jgi:hypothetical protein